LPAEWVPSTVWWLVEGEEYIGEVSIRHWLTVSLRVFGGHIGYTIRPSRRRQGYGTLILQLALEKAREMGLERVLLTCHARNVASRRVIEANGGVLQDQIVLKVRGEARPTLRFWIGLGQRLSEVEVKLEQPIIKAKG
jgi:predicted acetyltransferase